MNEHDGVVTFQGDPLTLIGEFPGAGAQAPDVELLDNELKPLHIGSYRGKTLVLLTVPSLDTSVCDAEVRRFNREAAALDDDVEVLVASMDLPFAQARWCGAAGIERVNTASDHRDAALGRAYGVLVKELRLLARSVFVIDREGVLRYAELVREISDEPDYEEALKAARDLS